MAASQFVRAGLAVYAVDLRGRGKSDGERFYVQTFDDYEQDVASVIAMAAIPGTRPPHFFARP